MPYPWQFLAFPPCLPIRTSKRLISPDVSKKNKKLTFPNIESADTSIDAQKCPLLLGAKNALHRTRTHLPPTADKADFPVLFFLRVVLCADMIERVHYCLLRLCAFFSSAPLLFLFLFLFVSSFLLVSLLFPFILPNKPSQINHHGQI